MSVGFSGTQGGVASKQEDTLFHVLGALSAVDSVFRHGDCIGADAQAHKIAKGHGFKTVAHPPVNESKRAFCDADEILPAKEYLERNKDIVNFSKVLIACPGQFEEVVRSGTWATIRYARKAKKNIIIIFPDGSIKKEIQPR